MPNTNNWYNPGNPPNQGGNSSWGVQPNNQGDMVHNQASMVNRQAAGMMPSMQMNGAPPMNVGMQMNPAMNMRPGPGVPMQGQMEQQAPHQRGRSRGLEEVFSLEGLVDDQKLLEALSSEMHIPLINLKTLEIAPEVIKSVPEQIARRHTIIPVNLDARSVTVAISDPRNLLVKDDVKLVTGKQVQYVLAPKDDIEDAINRQYTSSEEVEQAIDEFEALQEKADNETETFEENADISASPVVRLVNSIFVQAAKMGASDIHIEPFETVVRVRFRIDGVLREIMSPAKSMHEPLAIRIKILGNMDISEKRKPQDGRVETKIDGKAVDMRISILPTVFGEKIVIRLLKQDAIRLERSQLGFSDHNNERFDKIMKSSEGILLLTGPTGSGKTTTLYTVLGELNDISSNIITVEDPVEYRLDGVNQVQVNPKAGLTFASGLRSILRQDPDVVMIGEIRDGETAQIAFRAAITGHVVLSTLHTNDAASSLTRLIDMGVDPFLVSSAVNGIVAQRLIRKLCNECKEAYVSTIDDMAFLDLTEPVQLFKPGGCNSCGGTGFSGRTAIHEILIVNRMIRDLLAQDATIDRIKDAAIQDGMLTLHSSCRDLVLGGVTSVDQMMKVTYSVDS